MDRRKRAPRIVVLGVLVMCGFATPGIARDCPEFAGHMPGSVSVVEVSGDLAYVGNRFGFLIANVADLSKPRVCESGWSVALSAPGQSFPSSQGRT